MRIRDLLCNSIFVLVVILLATKAFAYDATANFTQAQPELVSGFQLECGPTKGGPYLNVTDCAKPPLKADNTYDCGLKNFTANPVYCVVSNYDSAKKKIATSSEATMSIVVQPPGNLKLVVTVTTISRLSKYGNIYATTTIKEESVPLDKVVKEGSYSYRNTKGEYVTNTRIVINKG